MRLNAAAIASFVLPPKGPARWSAEMPQLLGFEGAAPGAVNDAVAALLAPITAGRGGTPWGEYELEHESYSAAGVVQRLHIYARAVADHPAWLGGIVTEAKASYGDDVEDRYELLLELSPDALIVHENGFVVYANPAAVRFVGGERPDDLVGRPILDFVAPEHHADMLARITGLGGPGSVSESAETTVRRVDGGFFSMQATSVRTTWNGRPAFQVILRDLTERRAAEAALRLQANLVEHVSDAIVATDEAGRITSWNPAANAIFGWTAGQAIGRPAADLWGTDRVAELTGAVGKVRLETRLPCWNGKLIDVEVAVDDVLDGRGQPTGRVMIGSDITERRHVETARRVAQDRLFHQARHDLLTGLANRAMVLEHLSAALPAATPESGLAVLFLDLDRFKLVNDSLGHAAGDQVLRIIARRLVSVVRNDDLVGRLSGDEFVVLATGLRGDAELDSLAGRLFEALKEPIAINGRELTVSASIGIALLDAATRTATSTAAEDLLRDADVAMYSAKQEGRSRAVRFDARLRAKTLHSLELEEDLRRALAQAGISVAYQPLVALDGDRTVATEALARWQHPTRGYISPDQFIPLAEDTGLIGQLGDQVLAAACGQTTAWRRTLARPGAADPAQLRVSVNLSGRQLSDPNLIPSVAGTLERHELPASALSLEITESVLMTDPAAAAVTLKGLADLGVGLSVDDFGTGYSSLSYLRQFPVDTIKIDRSFISDICHDASDLAIVDSVIGLAHRLQLRTVAEGAETAEQVELLRELGCSQIQGYYFSRPLAPADLPGHLSRQARSST